MELISNLALSYTARVDCGVSRPGRVASRVTRLG